MTLPTCFIAGAMAGAMFMFFVWLIVDRASMPVRIRPTVGAPIVNLLDFVWHKTRHDPEESAVKRW